MVAAGKSITSYQEQHEATQKDAGAALGFSPKQANEYVKKFRASRITTEFCTRLDSAIAHVRNGYSITDACKRFHVVPQSLCAALRQQPKRRHFEFR